MPDNPSFDDVQIRLTKMPRETDAVTDGSIRIWHVPAMPGGASNVAELNAGASLELRAVHVKDIGWVSVPLDADLDEWAAEHGLARIEVPE